MAKKRLFSTRNQYGKKKSGRWGRLNAEERVELYKEKAIFNVDDVRKLPKNVVEDLRTVVKHRERKVGSKRSAVQSIGQMNAPALMERWAEQQSIIDEMEIQDKQKHPEKYGLETPPDYPEYRMIASDNDKWTILRRLAQLDGTLNIDRAYASQTLRDIQEEIDKKEHSIEEITEMIYDRLEGIKAETDRWNEALEDFADDEDDALLAANRGFHGISKARAHDEATKAGRTRNRKSEGSWRPTSEMDAWRKFLAEHNLPADTPKPY